MDIDRCIVPLTKSLLFADDMKLFWSANNAISMTEILSRVLQWCGDWQLSIAEDKCAVVNFFSHDNLFVYNVSNTLIDVMSEVKDLSILFISNLNFTHHIHNFVNIALQQTKLIFCCFYSKSMTLLVKAFKTYVRPLLECGTVIWSPYHIQ